jgi:flavin reductase (DIM6/NTAB) family NADH-FMN oxidoreductase RutF
VEAEFATLKLEDLSVGEVYDLLTACIAPRPIGFISSVDAQGVPNLAPFSFFSIGGVNPPSVIFSAVVNANGSTKETYSNVQQTGEFVINTVHRDMMPGVARAATPSDTLARKWERSGFTQLASLAVRPPRIAESLAQLECKVHQVVEHGLGPGSARYVIGEVLLAHVSPEIMRSGRVAPDLMHPIARMAGKNYVDTSALELFHLEDL